MKTALRPEEERTVTPGPKAVEDLLILPAADNYLRIDNMTPMEDLLGGKIEDYDTIRINKSILSPSDARPRPMTLAEARQTALQRGEFIPSAPLLLFVLYRLAISKTDSCQELLRNIQNEMNQGILVNTEISEWRKEVIHYDPAPPRVKPYRFQLVWKNTATTVSLESAYAQPDMCANLDRVLGDWTPSHLYQVLGTENIRVYLPPERGDRAGVCISRHNDSAEISMTMMPSSVAAAVTMKLP